MMSGIRNSPPISISSPRETSTCLPFASAARRKQQGGGAVVHDQRVLGAGDRGEHRLGPGRPSCRAGRSRGRPPDRRSRAPRARLPRTAASGSGARPRFVCSTTPVALITGVRPADDPRGASGRRGQDLVGDRRFAAVRPRRRGPARASRTSIRFSNGRPKEAAARLPGLRAQQQRPPRGPSVERRPCAKPSVSDP